MKLSAVFRKIPIFGTRLDRMLVLESGLFDPGYYLERYPDVTSDPLGHYLQHGALEMRDPSPFFRTRYYLEENPTWHLQGSIPSSTSFCGEHGRAAIPILFLTAAFIWNPTMMFALPEPILWHISSFKENVRGEIHARGMGLAFISMQPVGTKSVFLISFSDITTASCNDT